MAEGEVSGVLVVTWVQSSRASAKDPRNFPKTLFLTSNSMFIDALPTPSRNLLQNIHAMVLWRCSGV